MYKIFKKNEQVFNKSFRTYEKARSTLRQFLRQQTQGRKYKNYVNHNPLIGNFGYQIRKVS